MSRLLICTCGKNKDYTPAPIPAIRRYRGPFFGMLRKLYQSDMVAKDTTVVILSAKFGIIALNHPTPYYDQKLTPERAEELRASVAEDLNNIVTNLLVTEVFIKASALYKAALKDFIDETKVPVKTVTGPIGVQNKQTKLWLMGGKL